MSRRSTKITIDDIVFDSKMESRYYRLLKKWQEEGIVEKFELQPEFVLQERFIKHKRVFRPITYKADFFVVYTDGRVEVVDVKGRKEEVFKIKHKLFEHKYRQYTLKLYTDELQEGHFIEYSDMLRKKGNKKRETGQKKKTVSGRKRRNRLQKSTRVGR